MKSASKIPIKSWSVDKASSNEVKTLSKKMADIMSSHLEFNGGQMNKKHLIHQMKDMKLNYKSSDWSNFEGKFATESDFHFNYEASFLQEILDILQDYISKLRDRDCKVLDFHHPHQLKEVMEHCIDLPANPKDLEELLSDCRETLKYCVKSGHPRFFNQISCGLDTIALAGEFLTATVNTNMFTYEIAPVFTLMEEVTLRKLRKLVGWSSGDGIFAPGGAIANLYAVLAVRYVYHNKVKELGMVDGPRLVIFTSEQAHFSIKRAGMICGLGLNQVKMVPTDSKGKMQVDSLVGMIEASLAAKERPCMISATGGTTVLGAFDPLEELSAISRKYGLWLHVDCAWGGGALLSNQHRHLLRGIELADSVTWNPHKAMGINLQCSVILLKQDNILEEVNSLNADYLFQKDKNYDTKYDTGDKAIQCGRRNDVFKLWLTWRAKGDAGFENQINKLFTIAEHFYKKLLEKEGFELVLENPQYLNICFWYIPERYRDLSGPSKKDMLHQVTAQIKAMMLEKGNTIISYQPLLDKPNFFRMIISNPDIEKEDLEYLLEEIVKFGETVEVEI